MKKISPGFVMRISLVLSIALIVTGAVFVGQVKNVNAQAPEMVTLCHAAGQEGTLQFTTLTIAYNAAYGQAGHFNEDGTPTAGHENDYLGACNVQQEPTATPTTPVVGGDPTPVPTLGVPVTGSDVLIPVTGVDLTGGGSNTGKLLLSLGFAFLGLGIVSYGISKKQ
jgi:hypothetical protein